MKFGMKLPDQLIRSLHTMHPQDWSWLIDQFSESERTAISKLVTGGEALTQGAGDGFELLMAREELSLHAAQNPIGLLSRLDPSQIAAVLKHEPDWLIRIVLDAYRWPWHDIVLTQLGADREARLSRAAGSKACTSLINAILEHLYERAREIEIESPSSPLPIRSENPALAKIKRWAKGPEKWRT